MEKGLCGVPDAQLSAQLVSVLTAPNPVVIFSTDFRRVYEYVSYMCADLCGQMSLCQRIQAQERKDSISWDRINRMLVDLRSGVRVTVLTRSGLS